MTNPPYLLDTDICSYRIRGGNPLLIAKLRYMPASSHAISAVSAGELLFGIKKLPAGHARQVDVELFLQSTVILAWDSRAAEAYADIRHTLTTSAQLIGELDMMIAAHALALDAILVTNSTRHFNRIAPPLRIENWTEA